jgi:hypothetical protein
MSNKRDLSELSKMLAIACIIGIVRGNDSKHPEWNPETESSVSLNNIDSLPTPRAVPYRSTMERQFGKSPIIRDKVR